MIDMIRTQIKYLLSFVYMDSVFLLFSILEDHKLDLVETMQERNGIAVTL